MNSRYAFLMFLMLPGVLILAVGYPLHGSSLQITSGGYKISDLKCSPKSCKAETQQADSGRELISSNLKKGKLNVNLEWYDFTSDQGRALVSKHTQGQVESGFELQVWFKGLPDSSSVSFQARAAEGENSEVLATYVMHDLATRKLNPQMPVAKSDMLTFGTYFDSPCKARITISIFEGGQETQKIELTGNPLSPE